MLNMRPLKCVEIEKLLSQLHPGAVISYQTFKNQDQWFLNLSWYSLRMFNLKLSCSIHYTKSIIKTLLKSIYICKSYERILEGYNWEVNMTSLTSLVHIYWVSCNIILFHIKIKACWWKFCENIIFSVKVVKKNL